MQTKYAAGATGAAGLGAPNLMWALEKLGVPISPNIAVAVAIISGLLIIVALVLCIRALTGTRPATGKGFKAMAILLMLAGGTLFSVGVYMSLSEFSSKNAAATPSSSAQENPIISSKQNTAPPMGKAFIKVSPGALVRGAVIEGNTYSPVETFLDNEGKIEGGRIKDNKLKYPDDKN